MGSKTIAGAAAAIVLLALAGWGALALIEPDGGPHDGPAETSLADLQVEPSVDAPAPQLEGRFAARGAEPREPGASAPAAESQADPGQVGREGDIAGRVLDADGRVPEGVEVVVTRIEPPVRTPLDPSATPAPRTIELEADGRFRARDFESRPHRLRVTAPGHATLEVEVRPGGPEVVVALEQAVVIAGRVVAEDPRMPLGGVTLVARPEETPVVGQATVATTGAEGRFAFEGLAPGRYIITLSGAGGVFGGVGALAPVRIGPVDGGRDDVEIPLRRGDAISGTVVDAGGEPITTLVRIEALGLTDEDQTDYDRRYFASSGHDGTFRLDGLVPGRYRLGFNPSATTTTRALRGPRATYLHGVASGSVDLQVTLLDGVAIHGQLLTEEGQPLTGGGFVQVRPTGTPSGGPQSHMCTVDDEGRFHTAPLDTALTYHVFAGGFEGRAQAHVEGVAPSETAVVVTVPHAVRITGRVIDEKGAPAVGTAVTAYAVSPTEATKAGFGFAYVDAKGFFALEGLEEIEYTLRAGGASSGFVPLESRTAKAGATGVVLRVKRGVPLAGRIVDAHDRPIKSPYISVTNGTSVWFVMSTEDDGSFRFPGVTKGKLRISARLDGGMVSLGEVEAPNEDLTLVAPE